MWTDRFRAAQFDMKCSGGQSGIALLLVPARRSWNSERRRSENLSTMGMTSIDSRYYRVMRTLVSAFIVIGCLSFLMACAAEGDAPVMATREECEALRSIEARIAVSAGAPTDRQGEAAKELARHESNLAATGGEDWLLQCMKERTAASVECARQARSMADLESCSKR
jgi:hypothetical protein